MTIIKLLEESKDTLKNAGIENYEKEAEYLFSHILCKDALSLHLDFDEELTFSDIVDILDAVNLRASKSMPLQYIIGYANFYGRNFKVTKDVLIPRPETELLVEKVIALSKSFSKPKILEIGSGSGAQAITCAIENPESEVLSVDISDEALKIANTNLEKYNLKNVKFEKSNVYENVKGKFDIIFSNPPYIPFYEYEMLDKEVKKEPKIALAAADEGLYFYNKIASCVRRHLVSDGYLLFEIGRSQGKHLKNILSKIFKNVTIKKDYNGFDRIVIASNI